MHVIVLKISLSQLSSLDEFNQIEDNLKSLLELLPEITRYHSPDSPIYKYLSKTASYFTSKSFGPDTKCEVDLGKLGKIKLPFFSMGNINSTHLFGLDELILFCFYFKNKDRYKKVADLGANIGLHSIILTNLGYEVTSYEPDNTHFEKIRENFNLNCAKKNIKLVNKAISTKKGEIEFIRINDNSTSSHISGAKENYYGEIEKIIVQTDSFKDIIDSFDFLKIDVEGHEAEILLSTSHENWENTDAMVEVGSIQNRDLIYNFFEKIKVNLFSQKMGWKIVSSVEEMPSNYKEGSLFISCKNNVPW